MNLLGVQSSNLKYLVNCKILRSAESYIV